MNSGENDRPTELTASDPIESDRDVSDAAAGNTRVAHEIPEELIDADAVRVLRRLARGGYEAYLVGGGVRDLLLGRPPKDFDIATDARPNQLRSLFRNCRIIGRRFRLAHLLFSEGKVIEVATFRRDPDVDEDFSEATDEDTDLLIKSDNAFGEPFEDAQRRDFTINGLFYDLERRDVIDYVDGVRDIDQRIVRTIGDPFVRFRQDPIRILRAIKFSARLDLGLDPDLYDAAVRTRGDLVRAAPPRVVEEILRLLRGGGAQRSIFLTWEMGALSVMLPALAAHLDDDAPGAHELWARLTRVDQRVKAKATATPDPVLLMALLYGPVRELLDGAKNPSDQFEEALQSVSDRLLIPRKMKERMRLLYLAERRIKAGRGATIAKREFYTDAILLNEILRGGKGPAE